MVVSWLLREHTHIITTDGHIVKDLSDSIVGGGLALNMGVKASKSIRSPGRRQLLSRREVDSVNLLRGDSLRHRLGSLCMVRLTLTSRFMRCDDTREVWRMLVRSHLKGRLARGWGDWGGEAVHNVTLSWISLISLRSEFVPKNTDVRGRCEKRGVHYTTRWRRMRGEDVIVDGRTRRTATTLRTLTHALTRMCAASLGRPEIDVSKQISECSCARPTATHRGACAHHGKATLADSVVRLLIASLQTLHHLDLSNNEDLGGGFPEFQQNGSLETVSLSFTSFSGLLPDSIGHIHNLSRIELTNCTFTGSIPSTMANLTSLAYVDFSRNNFTGPFPSFQMSKKIIYIDLSHNALTGPLFSSHFKGLSELKYVILGSNLLSGQIPQDLFDLPSLQSLYLNDNRFEGQVNEFPNASVSQLGMLDLSSNHLNGSIPKSFLELPELRVLLLSFNFFSGKMQFNVILNLPFLRVLDLSYNNVTVDTTNSNETIFSSPLRVLSLASCKLEKFPNLRNQSKMVRLDLSDNQIKGRIPNWIWQVGNGGLTLLNLSYNLLENLEEPYRINTSLTVIDLHSNRLQGNLPIPSAFVVYVDYSDNNFSSGIPHEIGNSLAVAAFISLSKNRLTGPIPEDSFRDNPELCGFPLNAACDNSSSKGLPWPSSNGSHSDPKSKFSGFFCITKYAEKYSTGTSTVFFKGFFVSDLKEENFQNAESCQCTAFLRFVSYVERYAGRQLNWDRTHGDLVPVGSHMPYRVFGDMHTLSLTDSVLESRVKGITDDCGLELETKLGALEFACATGVQSASRGSKNNLETAPELQEYILESSGQEYCGRKAHMSTLSVKELMHHVRVSYRGLLARTTRLHLRELVTVTLVSLGSEDDSNVRWLLDAQTEATGKGANRRKKNCMCDAHTKKMPEWARVYGKNSRSDNIDVSIIERTDAVEICVRYRP
nr:verticillium wilt disease resistance protein [Ipomoea batatas]